MDKQALIKEILRLCNGPQNFRTWLEHRASQYADERETAAENKSARKTHFMQATGSAYEEWVDAVAQVYDQHFSEDQLLRTQAELESFRTLDTIDLEDKQLSPHLIDMFSKFTLLQDELDSRIKPLLRTMIDRADVLYDSRN